MESNTLTVVGYQLLPSRGPALQLTQMLNPFRAVTSESKLIFLCKLLSKLTPLPPALASPSSLQHRHNIFLVIALCHWQTLQSRQLATLPGKLTGEAGILGVRKYASKTLKFGQHAGLEFLKNILGRGLHILRVFVCLLLRLRVFLRETKARIPKLTVDQLFTSPTISFQSTHP